MKYYIGIDDTDNPESRGTGFRARELSDILEKELGLKKVWVTRHQLFVSSQIPYTSHNSSACLKMEGENVSLERIIRTAAGYLEEKSAPGSDPGLCVAEENRITPELIEYGLLAKIEVIRKEDSLKFACKLGIHLSEHGGTGGGVIGALAAVALCKSGNDGRFLWLKGIREMKGIYTAEEIFEKSGVSEIKTLRNDVPGRKDLIDVADWFKPVLLDGKPVLLVEPWEINGQRGWRIIPKDEIKKY